MTYNETETGVFCIERCKKRHKRETFAKTLVADNAELHMHNIVPITPLL